MNPLARAIAEKDWVGSVTHADAADWVTVAAYTVAAALAWRAARQAPREARHGRERTFWTVTAVLMIAFGINELLDVQTIVTVAGRGWAQEQGWYEDRRIYQFEFILALFAAVLAFGAVLLRLTRRTRRSVRLALLGLVFIGVFVLVRAASFHHVTTIVSMGPQAFPVGSMQEMAGILIVAVAAWSYTRRGPTRARR